MKFVTSLVVALCIFCMQAQVLAAQWIKTGGPIGGLGYNVKIHPQNKNTMFVTDAFSGVQKSINGGKTWEASNTGIDSRTGPTGDEIPVFSLTIDHINPNIVWVGTQNQRGVFKSIDGGKTFVRKDNGIEENEGLTIRNFKIDHLDSDRVLLTGELDVGVQGDEFSRVKGVIYLTEDGGDNWQKLWEGNSLARWSCLKFMLAATGIFDREAFNISGLGMLKSSDGGKTWEQSNEGLEGSLFIGGMDMHHDSNLMLLGTGNNNDANKGIEGGIFISKNNGNSWEKVYPLKADEASDIFTAAVIVPSNPELMYVGSAEAIYTTKDGGANWVRLAGKNGAAYGPAGVRSGVPIEIAVDPSNSEIIYVNNYGGGVFKSVNGGKTWRNFSNGYTGANIYSIAISNKKNTRILVNGRSGPFRSPNGGKKWIGVAFEPAVIAEGLATAIDPNNDKIFFITDEHEARIFKSLNAGKSWEEVFRHPDANASDANDRHGAKEFHIVKSNPDVIYTGFANDGLYSDPHNENFANSFGVYKSIDAGKTWTAKNSGLEDSSKNITAMSVNHADASRLYVGLREGGIYRTLDGGNSWTEINTADFIASGVLALAVDFADNSNNDVIYAGTLDSGIFKSTDSGASWSQVLSDEIDSISGLNPQSEKKLIRAIQIHSTNPQILFAADWYSGVYQSIDGGNTWSLINEGLRIRAVNNIELSPDNKVLYAATRGEGVFKLPLTN